MAADAGLLFGKTAVITGAGKGIGRAIALSYMKEGASVILAARTKADLESLASECAQLGPQERVKIFPVDLAEAKGVEDLATFVLDNGGCDVLVNNAGRGSPGNASAGDPDDWDKMIYLNLNGVMRLTRRLSKTMEDRKWGTVINMGSIAAIEGMSGTSAAYAAAKHGLRGWNHSIYQTLRHSNVKVVLINPAFVNTPLVDGFGMNDKLIKDRMIQPEDVAETCLLPFRMSAGCVPSEITLRLTLTCMV
jgi:3-oxoacyl-[acyl-carrier protein] reductase